MNIKKAVEINSATKLDDDQLDEFEKVQTKRYQSH